MKSPYLEFIGLEKRYGSVMALSEISLDLPLGAVLGLLGPNGAGKSTLFGCLLGLTRPTAGAIQLRGNAVTDAARRRFGYTAERVALYGHQTVWENGLFFAQLRGNGPEQLRLQLQRVGLDQVRNRKVRQLSKGMLQRLGLAVALCGEPELLVLDEPFNGLDPVVLERFREILQEEQDRGATLLISTHTISAIESLATHIAILLQGQLATFAPIEELRASFWSAESLEAIYHEIAHQHHTDLTEVLL